MFMKVEEKSIFPITSSDPETEITTPRTGLFSNLRRVFSGLKESTSLSYIEPVSPKELLSESTNMMVISMMRFINMGIQKDRIDVKKGNEAITALYKAYRVSPENPSTKELELPQDLDLLKIFENGTTTLLKNYEKRELSDGAKTLYDRFVPDTSESNDNIAPLATFARKKPGHKRHLSVGQIAKKSTSPEDIVDSFLSAIRIISTKTSLEDVARSIVSETCRMLGASIACLYFVEKENNSVMMLSGQEDKKSLKKYLDFPIGKGLIGWVASKGKAINIVDVHSDERYTSKVDEAVTESKLACMLAVPVNDDNKEIVAVLEAANKNDSSAFDDNDEMMLTNLSHHIGILLRNAQIYENSNQVNVKIDSFLDIVTFLHTSSPTPTSVTFTLTQSVPKLVNADRATLYLIDYSHSQLVSYQGNVEIRLPLKSGIAGQVASTGKVLNIKKAHECPFFNADYDKKSGYHTETVLCLPIKSSKGMNIIGVMQILNKDPVPSPFTPEDKRLLTSLLMVAGSIMEKSPLFQMKEKAAEAVIAQDLSRTNISIGTRMRSISRIPEDGTDKEQESEKDQIQQPEK